MRPVSCDRAGGAGLGCTAAARGYGTGVGTAAVTAAGGMHGFPAALTSFIGRAGALPAGVPGGLARADRQLV